MLVNWLTYGNFDKTKHIAQKDIEAIKVLKVTPWGDLFSPYQNMAYEIGEQMPVTELKGEVPLYNINSIMITEGYHSYVDASIIQSASFDYRRIVVANRLSYKKEYKYCGTFCEFDNIIVPFTCIIPKGTIYCVNKNYEIVSESIIIKAPHKFRMPLCTDEKAPKPVKDYYSRLMYKYGEFIG